MVRLQLAFSLGESRNDKRVIAALASLATRDATSVWTRTAVMSSIAGQSLAFLGELSAKPGFLTADESQAWLDDLAFLVGSERDPAQACRLLDALSDAKLGSQPLMRATLALGRGRQRAGGSIRQVLEGTRANLTASLLADAARITGSSDVAVADRLVAIRLLGLADQKTAHDLFPGLLDARQPTAVQLGVLQSIAGILDGDLARQIVIRWSSMSPTVRREGAEVLFSRRDGVLAVLGAFESRAILPAEIDVARLRELQAYPEPVLQARARKVLAAESLVSRDRSQVIAKFSPATMLAGDRLQGRQVFLKICATCHQAEGQGFDVGPNLATVANRSPEDLLIHILDPNREVAPTFVNYNVALVDGRVISGIIALESANAITLKRAQGASDSVARDQIATIAATGVSLMPEGLEKDLSNQDLANVIAFVRSIHAPVEKPTAAGAPK